MMTEILLIGCFLRHIIQFNVLCDNVSSLNVCCFDWLGSAIARGRYIARPLSLTLSLTLPISLSLTLSLTLSITVEV